MIGRALIATLAVAACAALAGCGGGSNSSTMNRPRAHSPRAATSTAAFVARADSICRTTLRRAVELGKHAGAFLNARAPSNPDLAKVALKAVVKPGIPILEHEAQRMRALRARAASPAFDQYVALFDPIEALAHELLQTGANQSAALSVEARMSDLGSEQRVLAHRLGLGDCESDYLHALSAAIFR